MYQEIRREGEITENIFSFDVDNLAFRHMLFSSFGSRNNCSCFPLKITNRKKARILQIHIKLETENLALKAWIENPT